ncbi:hydroxyacylglutathione hydrolase [Marinivivus vitaminiproducens]|uniref:hydroxyacylglutathione hydrolase n=1 Tax=Marinivivus vitaminiproducens TaxID=3035935 RepID=UPI0027A8F753|nr:hydroxyacylglutathione hydrolase [Geminicoccaceae bacterium SCSIO 64248]
MTVLEIERLPARSDNYMYLLHAPESDLTAIVDPADAAPVLARLKERGLTLDWIVNTHHHGDHTGGNLELKQATGAKVAGPRAEAARIPGLDLPLGEGDVFALGAVAGRVIDTPGHTAGHISLYFEEQGALFAADTLFALGCGRLLEGTPEQMHASLAKLAALPDDTQVYCGHEYTLANARFALSVDPDNQALVARAREIERLRERGEPTVPSRLGDEKATNPFLRASDPAIRRQLGMERDGDVAVFAEIRKRKDQF